MTCMMERTEVYHGFADSFTIRKRNAKDEEVTKISHQPQPLDPLIPDDFVELPWRDNNTIERAYSDAPEKYEYEPIKGTNTIRLLELLPGDYSEIIRIKLFPATLDHVIEFDALSYEWGGPVTRSVPVDAYGINRLEVELTAWLHILCEGKQMAVMKNLHQVLLRLRHPSESLIIWIDGICIDQKNEDEKPGQLMLMGKIYSQAKTVHCWIGEEKRNTHKAFRIISSIAASFHTKITIVGEPPRKPPSPIVVIDKGKPKAHKASRIFSRIAAPFHTKSATIQNPLNNETVKSGSVNTPPTPKIIIDEELIDELQGDGWLAVVDIFTRPYFGRVWVVQEIVLAQQPVVICGTNRIPWFDFLNVAKVIGAVGIKTYRSVEDLNSQRVEDPNEPDYVQHMKAKEVVDQTDEEIDVFTSKWYRVIGLGKLKEVHGTDHSRSLVQCLEQLLNHQVTKPVDRVYGMLGMITANSHYTKTHPIIPNYKKSDDRVYQEAAEWAIKDSNTLRILNLCEAPGTNVTKNLPTWVPDLSKGAAQCSIDENPSTQSTILSILRPKIPPAFNGRVMFVEGHIVDTVVVARAPFTFSLKPIFMMQHFKEFAYKELNHRENFYPTGCTKLEAFWRTLIANRIVGNRAGNTVTGKSKILKPPPGFDKHFLKYNAMEFISNWGLPLKLTGHERPLSELRLDRAPFPLDEMFPEEVHQNISILALMERQPFVKWMYECANAKEGDQSQWGIQVNQRPWLCTGDYGRQFFFTMKGWMGIGHPCHVVSVGNGNVDVAEGSGVKVGDSVAILAGSEKVWVLRNDGTGVHSIVGQAYVYGISDGAETDLRKFFRMKTIKVK